VVTDAALAVVADADLAVQDVPETAPGGVAGVGGRDRDVDRRVDGDAAVERDALALERGEDLPSDRLAVAAAGVHELRPALFVGHHDAEARFPRGGGVGRGVLVHAADVGVHGDPAVLLHRLEARGVRGVEHEQLRHGVGLSVSVGMIGCGLQL
jgi:hypothetical protein